MLSHTQVEAQTSSLDSLAASVRALQSRLDSLMIASRQEAPAQPQAPPIQMARAAGSYMNISFVGLSDFGWSTEPNVRSLQMGDHDPAVRGFTIPNAEIALDGTVDPHFKGFTNIVLKLNEEGETGIELEEMFLLTTSLPWNLQAKAGQFFIEFGRQNPQHPHAWSFVDQPLVLNRMFGPEGLRSQGARVSWLAPTPWYSEAMIAVLNSVGGTAFSFRSPESPEVHGGVPVERTVDGLREMLVVPRVVTSFDPTDTQTLLLGTSAALGPNNSGSRTQTSIYGVDLYWKWKSATADRGFPFVSLQSEVLTRRYEAKQRTSFDDPLVTLAAETLRDRGGYAQLVWGIKPLWTVGLRGDYVISDDAAFDSLLRTDRYRISPSLTWFLSEFSKLRLQYNYDHREGLGVDHSVWLQTEFILGAHAAHKF